MFISWWSDFVPSSNCYQPHDIAVRIPRFQRTQPFNSGRRVKLGAEADTCMLDPTKMGCGMQSFLRRFLEAALFFLRGEGSIGKNTLLWDGGIPGIYRP